MSSPRHDQLGSIVAAARSIAAQGQRAGVVGALLDAIVEAFDMSVTCVYLREPGTSTLRVADRRGLDDAAAAGLPAVSIGDSSLAGQAAATREIRTVDTRSPSSREALGSDVRAMGGNGTAWAAPLVSGTDVIGVAEGLRAEQLGRAELEVLASITEIASAALVRCSGSEDDVALRATWSAVRRANEAISQTLSILPAAHMRAAVQRGFQLWPSAPDASIPDFLRQVLQSVVHHARLVAGARYAALGIGDSVERPFDPWVFDGVPPEMEGLIGHHPRPVGTLGVVARQGKVVRVRQAREHPAYVGLPPNHPEITSLLGIPVTYGGECLGNLYLANKIGAPEFSDEDERAVEMLVTHAALALQQTYLRAAIEAHQAQVHSILESAPHGIVFVDAHTDSIIANPRAMSLLGGPLDPRCGRQQYAGLLRRPDGSSLTVDELLSSQVLRGERPPPAEFLIVRPDGREVPIMESASPVLGFGNRLLGAVVNFEEISAFKDLERMREEFAAMIVHDLRNPLQTILIQTNLLRTQESTDPTGLRRGLSRIEDSARRLSRIANDLLDTARIDLRRMSLSLQPTSLVRAAEAVIERLGPTLDGHPLRLSAGAPVGDVALDPARFEQLLTNLVENAARFSPPDAPIEIRVGPGLGGAVVSVEDHGIGIAPEEIRHLLDRFRQSKRARAFNEGPGLGLYICKGLAEAHGGRIWVESTLGKGSTFHVWLPPHGPPEAGVA